MAAPRPGPPPGAASASHLRLAANAARSVAERDLVFEEAKRWRSYTPTSTLAPDIGEIIRDRSVVTDREFSICYTRRVIDDEWEVYVVDEVLDWLDRLDEPTHTRVVQAIDALAEGGPGLGRPLVDTITGSKISNLKELRPGTVRILFVFDPWRSSILLAAGDKAGRWKDWYRQAIPLAEQRYEVYLKERQAEEEAACD